MSGLMWIRNALCSTNLEFWVRLKRYTAIILILKFYTRIFCELLCCNICFQGAA